MTRGFYFKMDEKIDIFETEILPDSTFNEGHLGERRTTWLAPWPTKEADAAVSRQAAGQAAVEVGGLYPIGR